MNPPIPLFFLRYGFAVDNYPIREGKSKLILNNNYIQIEGRIKPPLAEIPIYTNTTTFGGNPNTYQYYQYYQTS
jgi:hypothetical protein